MKRVHEKGRSLLVKFHAMCIWGANIHGSIQAKTYIPMKLHLTNEIMQNFKNCASISFSVRLLSPLVSKLLLLKLYHYCTLAGSLWTLSVPYIPLYTSLCVAYPGAEPSFFQLFHCLLLFLCLLIFAKWICLVCTCLPVFVICMWKLWVLDLPY